MGSFSPGVEPKIHSLMSHPVTVLVLGSPIICAFAIIRANAPLSAALTAGTNTDIVDAILKSVVIDEQELHIDARFP